jgi:hypothetical protein
MKIQISGADVTHPGASCVGYCIIPISPTIVADIKAARALLTQLTKTTNTHSASVRMSCDQYVAFFIRDDIQDVKDVLTLLPWNGVVPDVAEGGDTHILDVSEDVFANLMQTLEPSFIALGGLWLVVREGTVFFSGLPRRLPGYVESGHIILE